MNNISIRYTNVQAYTKEKEGALSRHITANNAEIILLTTIGKIKDDPIRLTGYNTFSVNKRDEAHAGSTIAIKKGVQFTIINNFIEDTIGAKIETINGPIIVMTSYSPPRQTLLPDHDLKYMIRNQYPTIFAGDLNCRHSTFEYSSTFNRKGYQLNGHVMRN